MTPNAWVLFDKTEDKYLTTGNTPFYGHSANPAEAHMYFSDAYAFRQAQILLESFEKNKKGYNKKSIELEIVPISIQLGKPESVVRTAKLKKKGFAVYIELQTDYMNTTYKGFWKRSHSAYVDSNGEYNATLSCRIPRDIKGDVQKADIWKNEDIAQRWAKAVDKGTREDFSGNGRRSGFNPVNLLHFKVEVRKV